MPIYAPPAPCFAYVHYTFSGAILSKYGVASVTDHADGTKTVTFSAAQPNTNYVALATVAGGVDFNDYNAYVGANLAASCKVFTTLGAAAKADQTAMAAFFR